MMTLSEWISDRRPKPPPGFVKRLASARTIHGRVSDVLLEEAVVAMSASMDDGVVSREAAFLLLAADAHITYACEAALDEGDVEEQLRRILSEIATGTE